MNTLGTLLQKNRQKQKISLEDAAAHLAVSVEFLRKLENDNFSKLPAEVYLKGFIRRYADFLDINTEQSLALFRRGYKQSKAATAAPPQPLKKKVFSFTPNLLIGVLISAALVVFFVFLYLQYRSYTGKPLLVVTNPMDQATLYQNYVEITGQTDADALLFINGQKAQVHEDGSFAVAVGLQPGVNNLTIIARSKAGKETTAERQVEVIETGS